MIVFRGHVGDRNTGRRRLRHGDRGVSECGAANPGEIHAHDTMVADSRGSSDSPRRIELRGMALPVLDGQGITFEAL